MRRTELGAPAVVDGDNGVGGDSGPQFLFTIRQTEDSVSGSIERITEDGVAIRITEQILLS